MLMPEVNSFLDAQVSRVKEQKRRTAQGLIQSFPQFLFIRKFVYNVIFTNHLVYLIKQRLIVNLDKSFLYFFL